MKCFRVGQELRVLLRLRESGKDADGRDDGRDEWRSSLRYATTLACI